jgi:hypothetical protein
MTDAVSALDAVIVDVDRLARVLKKERNQAQVRSSDERALAKATAQTWFKNHRPPVVEHVPEEEVQPIDLEFKAIFEASERAGTRTKYLATLKSLRVKTVRLRSICLGSEPSNHPTADQPPDFSPLITDAIMQEVLRARWTECTLCLRANAALAATVMMGGLLEAILLARINSEHDKTSIFMAKAAPRDSQAKTKHLKEWMLSDYIKVAHEMKWVSVSVRDVGEVLRDYRNYIHPYKQVSHNAHLSPEDAQLFWEVCKNITRQLIRSSQLPPWAK